MDTSVRCVGSVLVRNAELADYWNPANQVLGCTSQSECEDMCLQFCENQTIAGLTCCHYRSDANAKCNVYEDYDTGGGYTNAARSAAVCLENSGWTTTTTTPQVTTTIAATITTTPTATTTIAATTTSAPNPTPATTESSTASLIEDGYYIYTELTTDNAVQGSQCFHFYGGEGFSATTAQAPNGITCEDGSYCMRWNGTESATEDTITLDITSCEFDCETSNHATTTSIVVRFLSDIDNDDVGTQSGDNACTYSDYDFIAYIDAHANYEYDFTACIDAHANYDYGFTTCIDACAYSDYDFTTCIDAHANSDYDFIACIDAHADSGYDIIACIDVHTNSDYDFIACIDAHADSGYDIITRTDSGYDVIACTNTLADSGYDYFAGNNNHTGGNALASGSSDDMPEWLLALIISLNIAACILFAIGLYVCYDNHSKRRAEAYWNLYMEHRESKTLRKDAPVAIEVGDFSIHEKERNEERNSPVLTATVDRNGTLLNEGIQDAARAEALDKAGKVKEAMSLYKSASVKLKESVSDKAADDAAYSIAIRVQKYDARVKELETIDTNNI
eukprot:g2699.t1